ncbi:GntR family transcriptional regulator [Muricomes sp. OA1]|uniref:GntR family transcriptional regulator n=1 Tax=Lachnospiraceae TaxID=186803 RepID=UPI000471FFD2|nr:MULTISPECIES: GntR family transcriptional regulator [Lachnospiraceae]MCH1975486.1 GntR family transcriptional regulator [Muricomes sp. OA1]MRM88495.1 GntR family transcriptional regulator [Faecalicatena contorta]
MTSLNQHAYNHLKKLITTQQLSADKIYSETKLANSLGISRTPFHHAMLRLVQEGYIDILPSKGFCIHQLTNQEIIETIQTRLALEAYSATIITSHYTQPKAKELFKILHQKTDFMLSIYNTTQSVAEFLDHDFSFHLEIIKYIENEEFILLFNKYLYRMLKLATLSFARPGRMLQAYKEHISILETMEKGDIEHIYAITLKHKNIPDKINPEKNDILL